MTKKELAERNIGMTFDFIRQVVESPELAKTIRDGAEVDFIDKDMPTKHALTGKKKKVSLYKVEHVFEAVKG
ncbi:MAG: hypothetical protein HZB62_00695 [Nitrospirae bacterium]|nr:hypothetical protein [Nitrospirota bacterium]